MKLAIISATPMYGAKTGEPTEVYEPTLREIESVRELFQEVTWLGYFKGANPGNARAPGTEGIHLAALPLAEGGTTSMAKIKILPLLPGLIYRTWRAIQHHDVIHSRGPSVPAFVCIVLSFFFRGKKFWHKYAGNWMETNPPFMYKVQKWLLMRATNTKVTVNGRWPNQPAHIVSLENPCFTSDEREHAMRSADQKTFGGSLTLCFAGLIDVSKGVQALIRALGFMERPDRRIERLILAGHGPGMDEVRRLAEGISVPVQFTGYIRRTELNEVYRKSNVLLLPSRTEGFPKVVAEAAAFGCIPIVTDVSSIGQYVQNGISGFLLRDAKPESIAAALDQLVHSENLFEISQAAQAMSALFTYERFREAIASRVLT